MFFHGEGYFAGISRNYAVQLIFNYIFAHNKDEKYVCTCRR